MIVFETERLIVRELMDSDFDNLYSLLNDPIVMKYCSGHLNMKETHNWLELVKKYYQKYGYDYWAAIDKKTRDFIGQLGIVRQEVDNEWINCIAFMICKDKWGKGYATEGGKACITYGFQVLECKELFSTVEPDNVASKTVLKKIGMRYRKEAVFFNKSVHLYSIKETERDS